MIIRFLLKDFYMERKPQALYSGFFLKDFYMERKPQALYSGQKHAHEKFCFNLKGYSLVPPDKDDQSFSQEILLEARLVRVLGAFPERSQF